MTTREGVYIPGDYFLLCDVCGFKIRRSEARKRWDNAMVCSKDYEERHPLDLIQPKADRQNVVDARYADPVFVTDNQVQPGDL
jgi:hypothetical protein